VTKAGTFVTPLCPRYPSHNMTSGAEILPTSTVRKEVNKSRSFDCGIPPAPFGSPRSITSSDLSSGDEDVPRLSLRDRRPKMRLDLASLPPPIRDSNHLCPPRPRLTSRFSSDSETGSNVQASPSPIHTTIVTPGTQDALSAFGIQPICRTGLPTPPDGRSPFKRKPSSSAGLLDHRGARKLFHALLPGDRDRFRTLLTPDVADENSSERSGLYPGDTNPYFPSIHSI